MFSTRLHPNELSLLSPKIQPYFYEIQLWDHVAMWACKSILPVLKLCACGQTHSGSDKQCPFNQVLTDGDSSYRYRCGFGVIISNTVPFENNHCSSSGGYRDVIASVISELDSTFHWKKSNRWQWRLFLMEYMISLLSQLTSVRVIFINWLCWRYHSPAVDLIVWI